MKVFILGSAGKIGSILMKELEKLNFEFTDEYNADIIALCVSSKIAEPYLLNSNKILLNFTSNKIVKPNIINGIGCSTLSVIKPLLLIKELFNKITDINVVVLFPQDALSKQSKVKNKNKNIPIYTYEHKHQEEIENILGLTVNISHFITPVHSGIVSSITIKFKEQVDLNKLINYQCFTRDKITWNIISEIDNLHGPVDFMINKLNLKLKENK